MKDKNSYLPTLDASSYKNYVNKFLDNLYFRYYVINVLNFNIIPVVQSLVGRYIGLATFYLHIPVSE